MDESAALKNELIIGIDSIMQWSSRILDMYEILIKRLDFL
jgi:hypothetical protein